MQVKNKKICFYKTSDDILFIINIGSFKFPQFTL